MHRSCGDDIIDDLAYLTDSLHSVECLLVSSKAFKFCSRETSETMVIETESIEGKLCNETIRAALKTYKQSKLRRLCENTSDRTT